MPETDSRKETTSSAAAARSNSTCLVIKRNPDYHVQRPAVMQNILVSFHFFKSWLLRALLDNVVQKLWASYVLALKDKIPISVKLDI